ncbi:NUDIX domain-containing protein [Falsiroseomonas sp. HW251]|uniref:NUDIX domain-containing protein n=1 Tax=Falsiroseomonas sp. HW251 TaxID=3390998 RepID=UPI003D316FCE
MSEDRPDIERVSSRLIYENRWMRVREDAIRRRDGSSGVYGVIEKPDFVVVAPVHEDGSVTLVQQYRYPVAARHWEFCQGLWGPPGTDPALAAAHELAEETGLAAASLLHAGFLHNSYGTIAQGYHVFLGTGLTEGEARREAEEQDLVSRRVGRAEFERMIRAGEMRDGVTLAAWGLLLVRGLV